MTFITRDIFVIFVTLIQSKTLNITVLNVMTMTCAKIAILIIEWNTTGMTILEKMMGD